MLVVYQGISGDVFVTTLENEEQFISSACIDLEEYDREVVDRPHVRIRPQTRVD